MNKNTTLFLLLGAAAAAYFFLFKKGAGSDDVVAQLEAKGYTLTEKQKQLVRDVQSGKIKLESLTPAQQEAYRVAVLGQRPTTTTTADGKVVRTFEKAGDAARAGADVYKTGKTFVDIFKQPATTV
jgi:hypothetical protein